MRDICKENLDIYMAAGSRQKKIIAVVYVQKGIIKRNIAKAIKWILPVYI